MTTKPGLAQVYSLTRGEVEWLGGQAAALPGGWSLALVHDPAELSAVLLPDDGDRFAPSFLIERVADGYRLLACQWDTMLPLGVFPALADAMARVAAAAAAAMRAAPYPHLH